MPRTIAEVWDVYGSRVLKKRLGPNNTIRAKMDFYAGATAAYAIFVEMHELEPSEAADHMEAVGTELWAFKASMVNYARKMDQTMGTEEKGKHL